MPYYSPASASDSTKLPLAGGTMTGTITSTFGAITTNKPALSFTQEWNDGGTDFYGIFGNVTRTAESGNSRLIDLQIGGQSKFNVNYLGVIRGVSGIIDINGTWRLDFGEFNLSSSLIIYWNSDVGIKRNAAGVLEINNSTAGTYRDLKARDVFTNNGYLARAFAAITDGAGASTGTLTNAPAAGNPTKWLKVDDNGTTRYVPAW